MEINPGGRLNTQDVLGRDKEIAEYWTILKRQGLILSAERRIGKTHIALKMRDFCHEGYLPFYQDLEGIHSIKALIRSIYQTFGESLGNTGRFKAFLAKGLTLLPERLGNSDFNLSKENWQVLLKSVFEDLFKKSGDKVVLIMWDEFPLMLYNLQRNGGDDLVIELLDQLRALRQAHSDRLRFLFTGSIGLHLVIRSLQKAGNVNDPLNDMMSVTVPPMADEATCELATMLLEGTRADPKDINALAKLITGEVGGFPYYVHHVVDQLHQLGRKITSTDLSSAINTLIYDAQDPANFHFYVSRLSSYYEENEVELALVVLDIVAGQTSLQSNSQLINLCKHKNLSTSDEHVRVILKLLVEDHYLIRVSSAELMRYDFRWQLVKRWWKETRL